MNDWLVANINNPDFTVSDFKNIADMSIDNTQFLKKDQYLKSDFIKNNPAFKGNDGDFDQKKFDKYYDQRLQDFQQFKNDKTPAGFELDVFDTLRTPNDKVRSNGLKIGRGYNPDRQKIGIEGVNVWSKPEHSRSELAQTQKIFNSETGKFENWTPNDNALFNGKSDFGLSWLKSLFSDPLVLAQYEEDTVDKDGTKHKKGDYKLNEEGTYYYETLGGRSPIGKQVLSSLDTLTVDGTKLNKYDFFDSDDVEKSVGGVIAKNVATLIPMFVGGPIGTVYSTALIAREMAKSLPMLYGMTTALFSDSETPKWMNTIAAMGDKFTSGTSDYAKEHTFSIENFGNLISDVALQWGQQKGIAQAINKLKGSKNYVEEAMEDAAKLYKAKASSMPMQALSQTGNWQDSVLGAACIKKYLPAAEKAMKESTQLGRDASLAYMAIVSNSDVYGDALQHGASKQDAAAIALGSTLGMYAVDKYTHLGELFFDDATEDSVKAARNAIKNELLGEADEKGARKGGLKAIFDQISASNDTPANKAVQKIHAALNKTKSFLGNYADEGLEKVDKKLVTDTAKSFLGNYADDLKYHTTGFFGKAAGEGLEEVSEELVTDTAKSIYQLAGFLGADTSTSDVGAWDNALERYSMSFLGGALGGGVFYAKEAFDGASYKRDKSNEELATLIRNGHIGELRDEVEKLRKKGKLGSTKLSASNYETTSKGENVWLTTNNENDSQNQKIADLINDKITAIDTVINNNQVGLTDDQLFNTMVLGEQRYQMYKDIAPITNYYEDFNEVLSNLIKAELDYRTASKTLDGSTELTDSNKITDQKLRALTPEQQQNRNNALAVLQQKVEKARQAKDEFLSGDTSLDYTRKLNFALDPNLHSPFMDKDAEALWKEQFGNKSLDEISDEDKLHFYTVVLPEKQKFQTKEAITKSWDRFKQIEKVINPELHNLTDNAPQFKQWHQKFQQIVSQLDSKDLISSYANYDTKLDTESDDEYNARNSKLVDPVTGAEESDQDFVNRKNNRVRQIEALNDQKDAEWVNNIMQQLTVVGNQLDPIAAGTLKKLIPKRIKDVLARKIQLAPLSNEVKSILGNLNTDLSNTKEVLDTIKNSALAKTKSLVRQKIASIPKVYTNFNGEEINPEDLFIVDEMEDMTIQELVNNPSQLYDIDDDQKQDVINQLQTITDPELQDQIQNILANINDPKVTIQNLSQLQKSAPQYKQKIDSLLKLYAFKISKEQSDKIISNLKDLKGIISPDTSVFSLVNDDIRIEDQLDSDIESYVQGLTQSVNNEVNSLVADVGNNAIVKLHNSIQSTIKNPVIELVKSLAGKVLDKTQMPDVIDTLTKLDTNFDEVENIGELVLDSEQMKTLQNTRDALAMVATYLYAASSTPTGNNVIGHNKVMNEYAKKHGDTVQNWEELPEIDDDYATIYQEQLNQFIKTLDAWIDLSNNNDINKRRQFEETDKALTRSFNGLWQANKQHFVIDVKDKHYNLLDGSLDDNVPDVSLFNYEKAFYGNFQKALQESGMSVPEFLRESNILDKLISFDQLENQKNARLNSKMQYGDMSEYDKLQYLATILSLNPVDFYNFLKTSVGQNSDKAPIASQEYASKVAIAQTTPTYRDIMKYAFDKSGSNLYNANNTVIITGDAGSGKTSVVGKSVIDFLGPETKVLCVGPTSTQAQGLVTSFGRGKVMDIESLMKQLLGDKTWIDLKSDLDLKYKENTNQLEKDSEYFSYKAGKFAQTKLKKDLSFSKLEEIPNVIAIDEATHIPAPVIQVLDQYMKSVGGTLMLLGDEKQRSYVNPNSGIGNMRNVDLFASRTPELSVSLRDNNIQKQANLNNVKTLLSQVITNMQEMSEADVEAYWKQAAQLIPKLGFRVYNNNSLAGDLITSTLSDDTINKLKTSSDIGFIGDTSSAAYQALKQAGVHPVVLSKDQMQGQEFEYVVIDQPFTKPDEDIDIRNFLQDLYTLMSRGKTASIFIDNGLGNIIGKNIQDDYTAKAPSLKDKINGKSTIEQLKERKLSILDQLDLSPIEGLNETSNQNTNQQSTQTTQQAVNPTDFKAPESLNIDKDTEEAVNQLIDSEEETKDSHEVEDSIKSEFTVMSWGDCTLVGAKAIEETHKGKNGKEYKGNAWHFGPDWNGELRNISALTDQKSVFWYRDKQNLEKQLYQVKSALIFNHSYDETILGTHTRVMPTCITDNFSKDDWDAGTYELEIRSVEGEIQPSFKPMPEVGMTYKGNKYVANIVFKVKNKKKQICKFDLAGINNPETLTSNLSKIKDRINQELSDPTISNERKSKLQNILNTIENRSQKWANLFDSWINKYNKEGSFSIDISKAIVRQKHTWFTKRTGPEIRLGGRIDPNAVDNVKDFNNMKDRNPGFVFSEVYTYAAKDPTLLNIDPSLKGKAVVFVSSDTLLKPEDLVKQYINQIQDPEHNQPIVRMIRLHNYGMTFSQMTSNEFCNKIQGGDDTRLPYRANYHGIQMFVSLWNWRAALSKFNEALNNWMQENQYDAKKLDTLIKAQNHLFNNKQVDVDAYLTGKKLTRTDLNNLEKFNQEVCKDIPTFRLGYSEKHDFHIQRFKVAGSQAYRNKSEANLIVITLNKAKQFYQLSNRILGAICPSAYADTLGLQLLHPGAQNPDGTREPDTPWEENEFIDINSADHQRTLSGLFTSDLRIVETKKDKSKIDVIYKQGEQWSAIPRYLGNILRTITFYQYNPDQLSGDYSESAKVSWNDNGTKKTVSTQIGDLFGNGGLLKTKKDVEVKPGEHPDRSLADMFDLMFHGTTDDIHRKYDKDNPLMRADDARFPYGFFINPDISRTKESASSTDIISIKAGKETIFYPIKTSDELFTSDNDLRAAGIDLSIDELLNNTVSPTNSTNTQTSTAPATTQPKIIPLEQRMPVAAEVLKLVSDSGSIFDESTLEEAVDKLNKFIKDQIINIFKAVNQDQVLKLPVNYTYQKTGDVKKQTLKDVISSQIQGDFNLKTKSINGESKLIVENNGTEYELDTETWTLKGDQVQKVNNRFDELVDFDGKKVKQSVALNQLLNSQEFREQINDDDTLTSFIEELNTLINNAEILNEDQISEKLHDLVDNLDYIDITGLIEENYPELYKIFEC